MKASYLDSFAYQFEYGFKKLTEKGAVFTNANHFHAITTTAAGHATIATGNYPSKNGIVGNDVYLRSENKWEYSILDTSIQFEGLENCTLEKVSAKNLLTPSFGDYQKLRNPKSKVFSVALKDRSSILMGGKNADRAYWFDSKSTQMVSSDYYNYPFQLWIKDFTGKQVMNEEIDYGWEISSDLEPNKATSIDSFVQENGSFYAWFPHSIKTFNPTKVNTDFEGNFLWSSPFGDQFVLKFSEQLISNEKLGADKNCDILTVGLSAADYIGHQFGPNSLEVLDYYNRLDEYLGSYIDFLDENVGKNKYLLVLTADHGVASFPEIITANGGDAKRVSKVTFSADMTRIDKVLQTYFGLEKTTFKKWASHGIEPDFEYLTSAMIDSSNYLSKLEELLKELDYITEVYTEDDILDAACHKAYIEEFRNSFYPNKNMYVQLLSKLNYLLNYNDYGTTHGTPYVYDTQVPLIFYGFGIKPSNISKSVRTVDIAPSILSILGIETYETMDGKSILTGK